MECTDKIYSIEELRKLLAPIFEEFHIKRAAVFGSYARGESEPGADIDLVIKTEETFDLDKYYEFEEAMKRALQTRIDVTFEEYINPYMKETILAEAVSLFDKE